MNRVDKQYGFTIVELMLAMGFVAALLIAIAMTVIQISNIYNRGVTLKEVNQVGRSISSELQRSIAESTPFSVDPGVGSQYLFIEKGVFNYYIKQDWGGRLCLGQYSYVWNYGEAIQSTSLDPNRNVYLTSNDEIRLVKVHDPSAEYCKDATKKVDFSTAIELINVGQHNLALHSLTISTAATAVDSKTGQQLYNIEFLLGTNDQAALMYDSGTSALVCKPPSENGADPSYCSINQFNIIARAGNTIQ